MTFYARSDGCLWVGTSDITRRGSLCPPGLIDTLILTTLAKWQVENSTNETQQEWGFRLAQRTRGGDIETHGKCLQTNLNL